MKRKGIVKTFASLALTAALLLGGTTVMAEEDTAGQEPAAEAVEAEQDTAAEAGTEAAELPESFVLYISGIDVFGDVETQSRSDVNLLMAVNRNTGKILILNTPRDYYVELPISEGQRDKLTHAGIYGVDVSKGAMEMLYDITADYYARLNFSSFQTIIDALGGIEVYSEYDFSAEGYAYSQGMNFLNGAQALAFVRERKSFAEGDVQRGKDQMEMLKALIARLGTFEGVNSFAEVYDQVSSVVETNVTKEMLMALAAEQIVNGRTWDIETYYVTGSDGNEVTYSIPYATAYVMIPNEEEVAAAKEKLQAVLE